MPVVIVSFESNDDGKMYPKKIAMFDGSMKQAEEWCEIKNGNSRNWSTRYGPMRVGKINPQKVGARKTAQGGNS